MRRRRDGVGFGFLAFGATIKCIICAAAVTARDDDDTLDIPDPVLQLPGVAAMFEREDDVGVVLLRAPHLEENDIPYANLGSLLLYRVHAIHCCYSHHRRQGLRRQQQQEKPLVMTSRCRSMPGTAEQ